MITIAKRVEQLIEQWPMLKQGLKLDLLNASSVARYLKPEVEKAGGEGVSEAAVLMALRRYQAKVTTPTGLKPQAYLGDISVRTQLCDLTYANSPTLQRSLARLIHQLPEQIYITSSRGLMQTSVIVAAEYEQYTKEHLVKERLEKQASELTAITLHLKANHDQVAGILAYPLQLLAWRGIPVVELISTYDELNIILYDKDIEQAFGVLKTASD